MGKEKSSVGVAFDMLETEQNSPVGFKRTSGHVAFDVKMHFTRKTRWVLYGINSHHLKVLSVMELLLNKVLE